MEKCRYWLRGCPHFTIRTDHKGLESIYNNKPLDEISNKISDIVVSTYQYNFTVEYIRGKDNELADHLSRHPIWSQEQEDFGPWITDDFRKKITVESHINTVQTVNRYEERMYEDPLLDHMHDQGAMDTQYSQVIQAIRNKKQKVWVLATSDNPCRDYVSVWDHLGLLDKKDSTLLTLDIKRLIVPLQARKKILEVLHYSYQGITKTYAAARTRYY